jgi:hypothetical protein
MYVLLVDEHVKEEDTSYNIYIFKTGAIYKELHKTNFQLNIISKKPVSRKVGYHLP